MPSILLLLLLVYMGSAPALAARKAEPALNMQAVNDVQWSSETSGPVLLKAQVLLDRAGFSPGSIDARQGDNFEKALRAFQQARRLEPTGKLDRTTWDQLVSGSSEPILRDYTVTTADVSGPFAKNIPTDFERMARLDRLAYHSPRQLLAEKFHLSEQLLEILNRGKDFSRAGTTIHVANAMPLQTLPSARAAAQNKHSTTGSAVEPVKATRVVVNKSERAVRVLGSGGALLAFFPATIGSSEKPAPSGTFQIQSVTYDPTYRYDPRYRFKGQHATKPVEVAPGPNNPVGLVWIGLSAKSYGIHGTPDPDKISKTASHGCVRLTNWDALTLAQLVRKGTPVDFVNEGAVREAKK
jgi:lipoprotein-anchoring transpeptidase ErfK/SrfK